MAEDGLSRADMGVAEGGRGIVAALPLPRSVNRQVIMGVYRGRGWRMDVQSDILMVS